MQLARLCQIGAAFLTLSACAGRERIVTKEVLIPVATPCPAAADPPAKPVKPALPNDLEAALRVAVAHAARLSGWGDDLSGRLAACGQEP